MMSQPAKGQSKSTQRSAAMASRAIVNTLRIPKYAVLFGLFSLLSAWLIQTGLNWNIIGIIWRSPLTVLDKIDASFYGVRALPRDILTLRGVAAVLFALSSGLNFTLLLRVITSKARAGKAAGASGAATAIGAISAGCISCGSSVLTPILLSIGASTSGAISHVSAVLLLVGLLVNIYSIRLLSSMVPAMGKF